MERQEKKQFYDTTFFQVAAIFDCRGHFHSSLVCGFSAANSEKSDEDKQG
ncbi:hypothetical protein ABIC74_000756 [Mucilaginibacter rubeus]